MMRRGRVRMGFAPVSVMAVLVVLTACATAVSLRQARPDYPVPLIYIIMVNEGLALLATLAYGIVLHLAMELTHRLRK